MKEYTITLNEADVKRIMRALYSRDGYFRLKAIEKGNAFAKLDMEVADDYKRLFEMFKAL